MRTLLFSFLCAFAAIIANASTPPEALKNVHTIVCLGDSITQQGEAKGGYVWLVRQYLTSLYPEQKFNVINAGISGHRSNDMLARLDRDVIARKPDLVTISVGINDVWHGFQDNHPGGDGPKGIPLADFAKNVDVMVTKITQAGAKAVVLSTTVITEDVKSSENKKLKAYNSALRKIAKDHDAIFVDLQKPFHNAIVMYTDTSPAHVKVLTVDGVHLNPEGNRIMAKSILNALGVTPAMRQNVRHSIE